MEMKYVVPDMAQSFGTLEFAGESEPIFERDKNNRRVLARRSYNLYSDVQKGENVVVEIPVQAGEKKFKYEQKVKLVNPKLYGRGYAIGDMGHTDYVLVADDIVAVEEPLLFDYEYLKELKSEYISKKKKYVIVAVPCTVLFIAGLIFFLFTVKGYISWTEYHSFAFFGLAVLRASMLVSCFSLS